MTKNNSVPIILSSLILYCFLVYFFYDSVGDAVSAFAVITIVMTAWFFGRFAGIGMAVFVSVLTVTIFIINGFHDMTFLPQYVIRSIVAMFIGFMIGYSREESLILGKVEQESSALKLGIEKTKDVIFITDSEGIITYANSAFTTKYGYSESEWKGQTPRLLKSGSQTKEFYTKLWTNLKAGKSMDYEIVNKTKSGDTLIMQASANPIIGKDGKLMGYMAIQHDITEKKKVLEELSQRTEELQKLNSLMIGRELKMAEMKEELNLLKVK